MLAKAGEGRGFYSLYSTSLNFSMTTQSRGRRALVAFASWCEDGEGWKLDQGQAWGGADVGRSSEPTGAMLEHASKVNEQRSESSVDCKDEEDGRALVPSEGRRQSGEHSWDGANGGRRWEEGELSREAGSGSVINIDRRGVWVLRASQRGCCSQVRAVTAAAAAGTVSFSLSLTHC